MKKGSIILEQHFEIGYSTSYVTNINPNEFFLKHKEIIEKNYAEILIVVGRLMGEFF